MQELIEKVEQWAEDKGINQATDWRPQFGKIAEEVGEFKRELEISSIFENHEEEMIEMGDIMVTLIIMAEQRGYDLYDCLAMAYAKIKNRKGKTINGSFVKQEDIGKGVKETGEALDLVLEDIAKCGGYSAEDIGKGVCSLGG